MRNRWKKIVILLLVILVIYASTGVYASFPDVPEDAAYTKSVGRLASLGIITGNESGEFKPNDMLTREQFAKVIVQIANLEDRVSEMKSSSSFSDISSTRWSSGYIEVTVDMGYINGKLDGRFHPNESITYAEACTAMVKMLGYSSNELTGIWPDNYIYKAKEIGISDGVDLPSHEALPRWAAAVMLDNLMNTPMKSNPQLTLAEANELYIDCIVLETAKTSTAVAENEVLTDKGVFTISPEVASDIQLALGKRSRLEIVDDVITKTYESLSITKGISVGGFSGTTVTYREGGILESFTLPSKTQYYYKGKPISYEEISGVLEVYSSIVLNANDSGTGYESGVIYNPIYSEPVIAMDLDLASEIFDKVKLSEEIRIDRNGELIRATEIVDKDVVYQVSDIWESNKYIQVVDRKAEGEITAFLPNKISPKSIEINGASYQLSSDIDFDKITKQGMYEVEDSVTLLLGYDGKAVDIYMNSDEDNHDFALVIDDYDEISTSIEEFGQEIHYVKLLHIDGTTKIYEKENSDDNFNGQLVKYEVIESDNDEPDKVVLNELENLPSKAYTIDKEEKMLDESYFSDNVKIFNLIYNIYGADSHAYIIDVDNLPNGKIESDKIKYINKVGDFEDINVMLVEDILDESTRLGLVTKTITSYSPQQGSYYTHTVLIDGVEYITNHHVTGMSKGDIVEVRLLNDKIMSVEGIEYRTNESSTIEAIDSTRIKIKDKIYRFSEDAAIYFKNSNGEYERKGTNDLVAGQNYGRISIYLDKSTIYGGKVELIVVGY